MVSNSKDIFDEIEITPGKDIFDQIEISESNNDSLLSRGAKGVASGIGGAYGDILEAVGIQDEEPLLPGEKARLELEQKVPEHLLPFYQDDDIAPQFSSLPTTSSLRKLLGQSEPSTAAERYVQKGAETIGSGAALGGGLKTLLSLLGGSLAGQTAKELGAPEAVASGVDIATSLAAGKPSKKLIPKKSQKALVEKLRKKGFTDKEITPLIQSENKLKVLGTLSSKGKRGTEALSKSKKKVGGLYEGIKEEGRTLKGLSGKQFDKFEESLENVLEKIPKGYRRLIGEDLRDLSNSEHKIPDLIDFYQDINRKVRGQMGGKAVLHKLKPAIGEALESISPRIAEDYKLTNQLYSKLSEASKKLKPSDYDKFYKMGKLIGVGTAVGTGNVGVLGKLATYEGGRMLARELLINPKLQNFSKQLAFQIKKNKSAGIRNVTNKMLDYLKKHKPEIYTKMEMTEE